MLNDKKSKASFISYKLYFFVDIMQMENFDRLLYLNYN